MSASQSSTSIQPSTAVVLAAGEGTRLRPLTANRPKPMLPAGTRPILEHVLNALVDAGITSIHLVVGYKANRVRSHFGPTYREVPITYHTQANQLGSGHALLQARDGPTDSFLLVNGDQVIDHRIVEAVIEAHTDTPATLAVVEGTQAAEYGAVELDDGEITALIEQPTAGEYRLFNAGVYAFDTDMFDTLARRAETQGELPLTDAIEDLLSNDQTVRGVRTDHFWMDATHPWDLIALSTALLTRGWVDTRPVDEETYVDESAHVHPDATLVGPVVIAGDTVIEAGAVVGPYTAIGTNVTVGAGTVLSDSVIDAGTTIGPNTTATDLIVGQNCTIGAACTAAGGSAEIVIDEQVYSDIDLGGVLADRVEVGGGATLEPGTLVGPDTTIGNGVVIRGRIDGGSEVVR